MNKIFYWSAFALCLVFFSGCKNESLGELEIYAESPKHLIGKWELVGKEDDLYRISDDAAKEVREKLSKFKDEVIILRVGENEISRVFRGEFSETFDLSGKQQQSIKNFEGFDGVKDHMLQDFEK